MDNKKSFSTCFWEVLDDTLGGFFAFMDKWSITRRATLVITIWVTVDSYQWAKRFVELHYVDQNAAWATAAVLAGVTALQGWVFKLYLNDGVTK